MISNIRKLISCEKLKLYDQIYIFHDIVNIAKLRFIEDVVIKTKAHSIIYESKKFKEIMLYVICRDPGDFENCIEKILINDKKFSINYLKECMEDEKYTKIKVFTVFAEKIKKII